MTPFLKNLFTKSNVSTEEKKQEEDLKNFEILKYDGIRAQRIGKWTYAERCFKEALHIKNNDLEVLTSLVQISIQLNKLTQATDILMKIIEMNPQQIQSYIELCRIHYIQENYNDMLAISQKAINIEPENAYLYYIQAQAYQKLGNLILAIANLTQAINKKEDFIEAYLMRGRILFEMQQIKETQADIEILLKLDSNNEEILLLAGEVFQYEQEYEKAIQYYQKVIDLNPFNEKGYELLALAYSQNQQTDIAICKLNEGIEICESENLYKLRGKFKFETGDKEGAFMDIKKAIELNPNGNENINGIFKTEESKQ